MHFDGRGYFFELHNKRVLQDLGIDLEFVQDNYSFSERQHTIRGLHFQSPPCAQHKIVTVTSGRILDVVVDLRRTSATFSQHLAIELSAEDRRQLLVPIGFAHGFITLEPMTEVLYKVTDYFAPECDCGILWSDGDLGIPWPVSADQITISDKDMSWPRLRDLQSPFH